MREPCCFHPPPPHTHVARATFAQIGAGATGATGGLAGIQVTNAASVLPAFGTVVDYAFDYNGIMGIFFLSFVTGACQVWGGADATLRASRDRREWYHHQVFVGNAVVLTVNTVYLHRHPTPPARQV